MCAIQGKAFAPRSPHVFEQFYRGEKSRSRATGGAGLGLAIAQSFIQAHGGAIRVESKVGEGTQFIFAIPKEQPPAIVNPLLPKTPPPHVEPVRSRPTAPFLIRKRR
ncbi:MAG: ATP-binding protein [Caldilineaceae bacterium]